MARKATPYREHSKLSKNREIYTCSEFRPFVVLESRLKRVVFHLCYVIVAIFPRTDPYLLKYRDQLVSGVHLAYRRLDQSCLAFDTLGVVR